jgi:purine-binding chemotaxis protein CheW
MSEVVSIAGASEAAEGPRDFVSMTVAGQLFGIPVLTVQDVLGEQRITQVPLAPTDIAGTLNLRGRIVTAIDMRRRLGLPAREAGKSGMNVVVERDGELYSLIVDAVGEVLSLPADQFERNPSTLDTVWREMSTGVYRLESELMVVLDVTKMLDIKRAEAA